MKSIYATLLFTAAIVCFIAGVHMSAKYANASQRVRQDSRSLLEFVDAQAQRENSTAEKEKMVFICERLSRDLIVTEQSRFFGLYLFGGLVTFSLARRIQKTKQPNQALEPTATAVTDSAAQPPRQP